MAGGFDPDAYLASTPKAGFDPDSYLAGKSGSAGAAAPSWSDVPGQAVANAPGSAWNMVKATGSVLAHPIDTAENIGDIAYGAGESLGRAVNPNDKLPVSDEERKFQGLKDYYVNRYGSEEGFKKALANDPVGVMADASIILSGGGTALARAPGVLGKVGEAAATAGKFTNPVTLGVKGVGAVAKGAASIGASAIGDLGTRTGETPLSLGYQAGQQGGDASAAFLENMRTPDAIDQQQMVTSAKNAVHQMKQERNAAYQDGMAGIKAATEKKQWDNKSAQMQYNARAEDSGWSTMDEPPAMMNFDKVDNKLVELNKHGNFQGWDTDPSAAEARDLVSTEISNFKNMDPASFHTPMGFDALKQRLYSLGDKYDIGSRARLYVDNAAGAVKDSIIEEAPEYAGVMKDYWKSSDLIRQIDGELSTGPGANVGTTLRKLQSTMRNNVNTNFGYRQGLLQNMTRYGAQNLPFQLAGQAMSPSMPVGLGKGAAALTAIGGLASGHPLALAALPFMSPRLMGEGAHLAGVLSHPLSKLSGALTSPGATTLLSGAAVPARSYLGDEDQ